MKPLWPAEVRLVVFGQQFKEQSGNVFVPRLRLREWFVAGLIGEGVFRGR
jgi:hypothetical protein